RAPTPGAARIVFLLVDPGVVAEGRDEDGCEVAARLIGRSLDAGEIVVNEGDEVRPVLGCRPRWPGRAPRRGAVIGAARDQHLPASRRRTGNRDGERRRVGPVL